MDDSQNTLNKHRSGLVETLRGEAKSEAIELAERLEETATSGGVFSDLMAEAAEMLRAQETLIDGLYYEAKYGSER